VDKVHRQHVAPARDLNLNANADVSRPPIDCLPLNPIYPATLLLLPAASGTELLVDKGPKYLASVRVFAFVNKELESGHNAPDLV